jgi:hypothetical protein
LLITAATTATACATPPTRAEPAPPQVGVTLEVFEDSLAPYGEWIRVARYGRV